VEVVFSEASAARVRDFSRAHSGKMIAVFVGDELIWTPLLEGEISDIAVIEGNFNPGEAESLANRIMLQ
jgi:preprotein translocase subunit SecD